jgi:hypothetical protein
MHRGQSANASFHVWDVVRCTVQLEQEQKMHFHSRQMYQEHCVGLQACI